MYDSENIDELCNEVLGNQPVVEYSDSIKEADTVSCIAETHWG